MKKEIYNKLFALENEVMILKKLKEMQKILLNTGAYSTSNIEKQSMQFDKVGVPQWERDIVNNMWDTQTKLSHKLLREINDLVLEIQLELKESDKN